MIPRQMTRTELETALDWAAAEGWNPGLDDAEAFWQADPQGFFAMEDQGQMVAAICVVNHDQAMAFLGLYICERSYRGRGFGHALWQHALGHAGSRSVALDGVPAQQQNYARSGFAPAGRTVRLAGPLPAGEATGISPARLEDRATLSALEAKACGYFKTAFDQQWFSDTHSRHTLVHHDGGVIDGLVTLRACRDGFKVGPLGAPSTEVARALLAACAEQSGGAQVMIDVPDDARDLAALCADLGLRQVFSTTRMYRGAAPMTGSGLHAVATLELG